MATLCSVCGTLALCVALCGALCSVCGALWRSALCVALCGALCGRSVALCVALCGALCSVCGALWRCVWRSVALCALVALCGALWRLSAALRSESEWVGEQVACMRVCVHEQPFIIHLPSTYRARLCCAYVQVPPVLLAAASNDKDVFELVVKAGGDPAKQTDALGRTALHYAAAKGADVLCDRLIALGLKPYDLDKQKNTPLHLAGVWEDEWVG